MRLYRMMKHLEPVIIEPVTLNNENRLIDLIYSNSMPSRQHCKEQRKIWSFAKTPEAAMTWLGPRGKGQYDRLAYYDFNQLDGKFYDLTELKTWVALIGKSSNDLMINNLNYDISVEAVRSIIPCSKGAWSMAKACEEVAFIPARRIQLNVVENLENIPPNPPNTESVITELC